MPAYQAMCERANKKLGSDNIAEVQWPEGETFSQLAANIGIAETAAEQAYLEIWPRALKKCLEAVIRVAVDDDVPTQMCWVPDYDYSVSVWDAHAAAGSGRAITIVLRGPYPPEPSQKM